MELSYHSAAIVISLTSLGNLLVHVWSIMLCPDHTASCGITPAILHVLFQVCTLVLISFSMILPCLPIDHGVFLISIVAGIRSLFCDAKEKVTTRGHGYNGWSRFRVMSLMRQTYCVVPNNLKVR